MSESHQSSSSKAPSFASMKFGAIPEGSRASYNASAGGASLTNFDVKSYASKAASDAASQQRALDDMKRSQGGSSSG
ncbi:uncharacterized protein L201_008114 [Kwoniella dendrophila CBS 6074]|uniref:SMP domain-containing protein n=1 Tax=Kwoniella dendrophila CBS 6074 TaxID=1295534 RepID=A0AAX4K8G9_9TREE